MAEPVLDCPRVVPLVSQRIATSVAQHVHVNFEWQTCALADPRWSIVLVARLLDPAAVTLLVAATARE